MAKRNKLTPAQKKQKRQMYNRTAKVKYRCKTCGVKKMGKEFPKDLHYQNGRMLYRCKECANDRRGRNKKRHAEWKKKQKRIEYRNAYGKRFVCRKCGRKKWGHQFPFHYRFRYGVYVSCCSDCKNGIDHQYYLDNKEKWGVHD